MTNQNLTPPDLCESLEAIRDGMDAIDREIVALMAERVAYVRAAANGEVIEALYRDLVAYCISEEKKHWETLNK
jgi:chorismate mutase